ncbi:hypothetical protein BpHYR1_023300 [Brachionus plicatilis]|uniref:Prion-like-(Q N-rich) domain-bearing 25 n=1 Tax=Brachionus plicatilis TaxID=10195 RepID=A0A3M7QZL7_BRAPC|nr:hypothetical protein BpHYR1_023300 [Brachionus plicatilis]
MCLSPMFCSIKFDCRCPGYFYFENTTSSCNNKLMVNANCNKDHQCRQDLGLTCKNGRCLCSSLKYTWSSRSLTCKLTYQKSICTADSDCNNSENLVCQLENPDSQFYRTCGCIKEENNENYWDRSKCVQSKTYRSDCLSNDHCKILTENTFCSVHLNKCECPNLHYWNGYKCMPKKTYLDTCLDSYECKESQLLFCNGTKYIMDKFLYLFCFLAEISVPILSQMLVMQRHQLTFVEYMRSRHHSLNSHIANTFYTKEQLDVIELAIYIANFINKTITIFYEILLVHLTPESPSGLSDHFCPFLRLLKYYSTDLFLWFYQNIREFTKILVNLREFRKNLQLQLQFQLW